jgi:FixJ family two-component response regulator
MPVQSSIMSSELSGIALVDGDPALRRARQLMLRSERFEVRAYATCGALLADPLALRSACVIADAEMSDLSGLQLLHAMRDAGWSGAAILLADAIPAELATAANDHDFMAMLPRNLSDVALLKAIRAAIA